MRDPCASTAFSATLPRIVPKLKSYMAGLSTPDSSFGSTWPDFDQATPGTKEIEEGCESSRVIVPLLTPNWGISEWTRHETYGAEFVIPLVVEGRWDQNVLS
jgi:hypothetical protein